jgi:Zn-finger nucleic acid-binding protein
MKCPLDKSKLSLRSVEGHIGYRCSECKGAWLPQKYVESVSYSRKFSYEEFAVSLVATQRRTTGLQCPSGCASLNESVFSLVPLNWCPSCKGVWFGPGSIAELLGTYKQNESGVATELAGTAVISTLAGVLGALLP